MPVRDPDRARYLLARRRAAQARGSIADRLSAEWFPAQRAFYTSTARKVAALCSRRAGKSRGGNANMLRQAATTPHGRFLYINETRAEAKRLAWYGARGDGMASLVERHKLPAVSNLSDLTIRFPAIDSWIYMIGADDEAGVRKALGVPYHEVWWDEAQKIPSKLAQPITEVLLPTLLDYGGRLRFTGTPVRHMTGMFYGVTRGDAKSAKGWDVHRWSLLDNPFFGRAELRAEKAGPGWYVVSKLNAVVAGPFETEAAALPAVTAERLRGGLLDLQDLLGGPLVAPLDSPIMTREGKGQWTHEDSAYVYDVHKIAPGALFYAPARVMPGPVTLQALGEGGGPFDLHRLPDLQRALADLPGWGVDEWFLALGIDIAYHPDPFAIVLWAWAPRRGPQLHEVFSWRQTHLDSNQQAAVIRWVGDQVPIGVPVADASNPARPAVAGWSKGWMERYGVAIAEAKKHDKYAAIDVFNGDMVRGAVLLREDGLLFEEMSVLQWSSIVSASGRLVEDPTQANDCCDAGLYAHRHSFHHRFRPDEVKPPPGSEGALSVEETAIEDELEEALYA